MKNTKRKGDGMREIEELADVRRWFTTNPDGTYSTFIGTEVDANDPWRERKLKATPFIDWQDGQIYLHVILDCGRYEWWKVTGRAGFYIGGYDPDGSTRWTATRCEEPNSLTPIKIAAPRPIFRSLDDDFDA